MILAVIYKFWETRTTAPDQQSGRQQRNYFGWIKSIIILVVVGGLAWGIVNAMSGTPDKIYSAIELKNLTTSGDWKLQNDEIVCNGGYRECKIVIPNKGNIGGLTVDPGMTALAEIDISFGKKYLIKYYSLYDTNCNGWRDGKKYHRAVLFYNGIASNDFCSDLEDNGAAEPLWIGTSYRRLLADFPGLLYEYFENPMVFIGHRNIRTSLINDKNMEYLGGEVKISSKKTIAIREVRITHSSYQWRELIG